MSTLHPALGPDDHVQGRLDAPLQLVEYGDYQCPYCADAVAQVARLQQALGDALCFAFRNFPLSQAHPLAERAAELAEAAAGEGLFWPMHDWLYRNQDALDDDASLVAGAQQVGLSRAAIEAAFSGAFAARVRADFLSGVRSGVNGTPCFFINGQRYDGPFDAAQLYPLLRQLPG